MARLLGRQRHLQHPKPRWPTSRTRKGRRPRKALRSRHVPLPLWCWAPRWSSTWLYRHRRVCAVQAHDGVQRFACTGLRQLRITCRTTRNCHRYSPACEYRNEHCQHASPTAPAWPWPRPTTQREHHRRKLLPLDTMGVLTNLQFMVRQRVGQGSPHFGT